MTGNRYPGFVAERSFESNRKTHLAPFSITSGSQVVPAMDYECWNRSFTNTYVRCTLAYFNPRACLDTAIGLADFVCQ